MDIAYVTDIEGQWEKLDSFCAHNPLVSLVGDRLVLAEGARFVFGGDAVDRGPHARRVVACLTEAKLRYPERVVLLAGNRDINKLRLARELEGHPPASAPDGVRAAEHATLLRWILAHTMGAPDAFEHRRSELLHTSGRFASDEAVVDSFLEDLAPGGALTQYLQLCELAYRRGTTLFVHGGLGEGSLGSVPAPGGVQAVTDLDEWIEQLNAWYQGQVAAYVADAVEPSGAPACQPLIDYQAPLRGQRVNPQSVVYARLADENNDPRLPALGVVERLGAAGIRRLVVGHMPTGDTPALLRDPSRHFELILADNSRARVNSASRVLLSDDAVQIEGEVLLDDEVLSDDDVLLDDERRCAVSFTVAAGDSSTPVGLHAGRGGPLIKAPLTGDDYLTFRALPGYVVQQRRASATTWRAQPLIPPYA